MTVEERKRLGANKSTLWQVKKGGETEKMTEVITEKIEFPELMPVETELISEQFNDYTEKIGTNTEQIDDFSEKIPEKITEKKRYRGQRGQDKAPRQLNYNSLMNLKPFKSNAATLEKETNSTELFTTILKIIGNVLLVIVCIVIVWKIIKWLEELLEVIE